MTDADLRPARSTDAGRTGTILSGFIDQTSWMPRVHTRAQDVAFAADMIDRGWVTVAEQDDQVVGFSARDGATVHALYVDMNLRGQGIGRQLLQDMQAKESTLSLWTFQANTPAQTFYAQYGFTEVERTDGAGNDEQLPDIRLLWKRGPS